MSADAARCDGVSVIVWLQGLTIVPLFSSEIEIERDTVTCTIVPFSSSDSERPFRVYKEAPGFHPGPRQRERRFRVYKEAPGLHPGPVFPFLVRIEPCCP